METHPPRLHHRPCRSPLHRRGRSLPSCLSSLQAPLYPRTLRSPLRKENPRMKAQEKIEHLAKEIVKCSCGEYFLHECREWARYLRGEQVSENFSLGSCPFCYCCSEACSSFWGELRADRPTCGCHRIKQGTITKAQALWYLDRVACAIERKLKKGA
jgi:hypothetical protein